MSKMPSTSGRTSRRATAPTMTVPAAPDEPAQRPVTPNVVEPSSLQLPAAAAHEAAVSQLPQVEGGEGVLFVAPSGEPRKRTKARAPKKAEAGSQEATPAAEPLRRRRVKSAADTAGPTLPIAATEHSTDGEQTPVKLVLPPLVTVAANAVTAEADGADVELAQTDGLNDTMPQDSAAGDTPLEEEATEIPVTEDAPAAGTDLGEELAPDEEQPAGSIFLPAGVSDTSPFLDVKAEIGATFGQRQVDSRTPGTGLLATTALLFQAPDARKSRRVTAPAGPVLPEEESVEADELSEDTEPRKRRRRGGRGRKSRTEEVETETLEVLEEVSEEVSEESGEDESSRRRRRRRRSRTQDDSASDEVTALQGSTRLEAKRQRRKEGRDSGRRRNIITEAEFLARRELVERRMLVRERAGRTQIAVLEDGLLVEHYVARKQQVSIIGNVYLGKVQNVLPSMEVAFVDIGKGRNAVLYAGEVNWDAAGLEGQPRRIEQALSSGDPILVQATKDPIGQKGARLTSQITLAGRHLVYVPAGGMTGISRKLPEKERSRLKTLLREIVPEGGGVIVRTAAEGASEAELRADMERLTAQWADIEKRSKTAAAPAVLRDEPDLAIKVVRDIFNEDFAEMVICGDGAWKTLSNYVAELAPEMSKRLTRYRGEKDLFAEYRVDEQLIKGLDRKVWLPSGGSLVIDRTEAMTVIDVNTGKFTGSGGSLEETVTRNNLEAAEEIVRQLRLRDLGGIIVVDFIDMVLESNRELLHRRLVECLSRDRTKHQVAEVTSLGLVQMTRKRVGQGLAESFTHNCETCNGRGYIVEELTVPEPEQASGGRRSRRRQASAPVPVLPVERDLVNAALNSIAAAAATKHDEDEQEEQGSEDSAAQISKADDSSMTTAVDHQELEA